MNILSLMRPIVIYSGLVALLLLTLNLYYTLEPGPTQSVLADQCRQKLPRNLHTMENFWYKGDQAIYNIVMFQKDIQSMDGVKIYLFDRQFHLVQIIAAARAQWQQDHWRFYQGYIQNFTPAAPSPGRNFGSGTWCSRNIPRTLRNWPKKSRKWMSMSSIAM